MREKYRSEAEYMAHAQAFGIHPSEVSNGLALERDPKFLRGEIDRLEAKVKSGRAELWELSFLQADKAKLAKLEQQSDVDPP